MPRRILDIAVYVATGYLIGRLYQRQAEFEHRMVEAQGQTVQDLERWLQRSKRAIEKSLTRR